ncbi:MAG: hypothetical protein LBH11_07795, partial [Propionibacteriaceae bacterium]|nr:hypothetical protein [Propionibacteriaceae bacterium]
MTKDEDSGSGAGMTNNKETPANLDTPPHHSPRHSGPVLCHSGPVLCHSGPVLCHSGPGLCHYGPR